MKETLGAYVKRIRLKRGLTLRSLAKKAGLAANTVRRIELDDGIPETETLKKLAKALEVPFSHLESALNGRPPKKDKHPMVFLYDQLSPLHQKVAVELMIALVSSTKDT